MDGIWVWAKMDVVAVGISVQWVVMRKAVLIVMPRIHCMWWFANTT